MSLLATAAIVLAAGMVSQWVAWRLHIPAILLLLAVGVALGPGFGVLDVDAALGEGLEVVIGLSVAVILFEGGLGLRFHDVRAHGPVVARLVTLGAVATTLIGAGAASLFLGLPWDLALLLGAILSVSGPTVVLPLLRHVRPSRATDAVLRWEGILIDPIGALLAVLAFEAIRAGGGTHGAGVALTGLALAIGVGGLIGLVAGAVVAFLEAKYLVPDQLGAGMGLVAVIGAYVLADLVQAESGLLAVTIMGIFLANQKWADVRHILDFKEDLTQILLGSLFVLLAARLGRDELALLGPGSWLFIAALILIARPVTVAIGAAGSSLTWRERAFLSWMAPRGIVAAAISGFFALRLQESGRSDADILLPVTFLAIIGTVTVYGLTARPAARMLGVAGPPARGVLIVGANPISRAVAAALAADEIRAVLVDRNHEAVTAANVDGLDARLADALDPHLLEKMGTSDIGMVWAITPNRTTNSLSAVRFADDFGRSNVYQLAVEEGTEDVEGHLRGRLLWDAEVPYGRLRERLRAGWRLARTPLTDEFDAKAWRREHGRKAMPAWIVRDGRLRPVAAGDPVDAAPGDILVAWVPPGQREKETA